MQASWSLGVRQGGDSIIHARRLTTGRGTTRMQHTNVHWHAAWGGHRSKQEARLPILKRISGLHQSFGFGAKLSK